MRATYSHLAIRLSRSSQNTLWSFPSGPFHIGLLSWDRTGLSAISTVHFAQAVYGLQLRGEVLDDTPRPLILTS